MNLKKVLTKDVICLDLKAEDKQGIIEELMDILVTTGKVRDRQAALDCIFERENKMSTGIQYGIAIPHGKSDMVDDLVACMGVSKHGVDFEALDNEPSKIFIMTISPVNKTGPHVQFLSEVSQLLISEEKRNKILDAEKIDDILSIID